MKKTLQETKIRKLNEAEIVSVYNDHMLKDFPQKELIPLDIILEASREGEYLGFGFYQAGVMLGYSFFARTKIPETAYLADFLGIFPEYRDSGFGTIFQKKLFKEKIADAEYLFCEVEDPDTESNPAKKETMIRRIRHHLSVGWIDTGVCVVTLGAEYRLMEYPIRKEHDPDTVKKVYGAMYRYMLPQHMWNEVLFKN